MSTIQTAAALLENSLRTRRNLLGESRPNVTREALKNLITARPATLSSTPPQLISTGSSQADLMFITELHEGESHPLASSAGELFTKILSTMALSPDDVHITGFLKSDASSPAMTDSLRQHISSVHPKVLVALGKAASTALLGDRHNMAELHGHWLTFDGIPLLPTYHPSYLLHKSALSEKRKVWEDMLLVMEKLDLPITPKQRGYFQKN